MNPQQTAKIHVRFLFPGLPKRINETKFTAMNTTKLIFILVIGENFFDMNTENIIPGMVDKRTTMKTTPDIVPLNPSSTRNVTATVVNEFTARTRKKTEVFVKG